jgi:hypothetical protein
LATGRAVFSETAHITVLTLTISLQWAALLCCGSAGEGYLNLAEADVIGVENPGSGVGIRVGIPLRLWDGTHNDGFGIFSGIDGGSFAQIGLVDRDDKTWDTKWRLGDGDVE